MCLPVSQTTVPTSTPKTTQNPKQNTYIEIPKSSSTQKRRPLPFKKKKKKTDEVADPGISHTNAGTLPWTLLSPTPARRKSVSLWPSWIMIVLAPPSPSAAAYSAAWAPAPSCVTGPICWPRPVGPSPSGTPSRIPRRPTRSWRTWSKALPWITNAGENLWIYFIFYIYVYSKDHNIILWI